jgi:heme/copper-type cytochrome/quinol oxidase subunit 2
VIPKTPSSATPPLDSCDRALAFVCGGGTGGTPRTAHALQRRTMMMMVVMMMMVMMVVMVMVMVVRMMRDDDDDDDDDA